MLSRCAEESMAPGKKKDAVTCPSLYTSYVAFFKGGDKAKLPLSNSPQGAGNGGLLSHHRRRD